MLFKKDWMNTYNGEKVYPTRPTVSIINMETIAQSLSQMCRYNGHTKKFYSVAEHSLIMSYIGAGEDKDLQLHYFLHDCHEFITGDISRPFKNSSFFLRWVVKRVSKRIDKCIYKYLQIKPPSFKQRKQIKQTDYEMFIEEFQRMMIKTGDNFHIFENKNVGRKAFMDMNMKNIHDTFYMRSAFLCRFNELYDDYCTRHKIEVRNPKLLAIKSLGHSPKRSIQKRNKIIQRNNKIIVRG